ncbi:MAG: molecular chaperone DnaJ [Deltaproteobacteria bacterium]|nr:molecular chaperone DnaJ [Deltaproteobacteria bacterium]
MKDPYEVLGVARGASDTDIKGAFRKLGKEFHPDRNQGDEQATQRFKEINAAYQILSDPQKRAVYDRFGSAGFGGGAGGPFPGAGVDFRDLNIDGIFGDLLDALGVRVGERGDLQLEVQLSFEEAAFGCTKKVAYDRVVACDDCSGSGGAPGSPVGACGACGGRGKVRFQQGVFPIMVERACSKCEGTGRVVTEPCRACMGAGLRSKRVELDVEIPAGIESGATRRIEGKGNLVRGRRPGDLDLLVTVRTHQFFHRVGDNVVCELPVTFAQAVLGDEVEIPTLDGKGKLRIPPGTQPGAVLRVRGKGIPKRVMGGRGDQLVEIQVEIPTNLTDRQKTLVEELARELGEGVQPRQKTFLDKLKDLFN